MTTPLLPTLQNLPASLSLEGAIRIELQEGIPIFRASSIVQNRIGALLAKQQISPLNSEEEQELCVLGLEFGTLSSSVYVNILAYQRTIIWKNLEDRSYGFLSMIILSIGNP